MTRPRAADDFATIRARLDELHRERAQANAADKDPRSGRLKSRRDEAPGGDTERQRARREGWPPPWVPTIFVQRSPQ
jgi:hypothetical protein